ncbi:MAG: hypothetical protein HY535_05295 [Chloroflexi bacterium]|nr:hypothetical protein [Chloroflexota bacterium]
MTAKHPRPDYLKDRLLSALLVPVSVVLVTAAIVIGIGELLLALARVRPELGGVKEPLSIVVALLLAVAVLVGASWLAGGGRRPHP